MTETYDKHMSRSDCLYWDGSSYQLGCPDDLCHGSDQTLCGLWHGEDFDVMEYDPCEDDFDDNDGWRE